ncbi:MAG: sensor histidine kinase [Phycisphaerales bacterium JB063]
MAWFFLGIAVGVLIAVPCAWAFNRRTERRVRDLERQARSAERLAEQATMTSGLAHEIKNPLSTIGLNVQLLQEDLVDIAGAIDSDSAAGQQVGRVQRRLAGLGREADRLREILEDFLRFAGRLELDTSATDINQLVDEIAVFFEPQAAEQRINLRVQCEAKPAQAQADASLLKQALLNLLINAVHAMADARDAGQPHGGASELLLRTTREDDRLCIHVTDTGPGIPAAVVSRVFEPYYSTKRSGTGLGLPTSRRIIEQHGGTLTVHSEVGRGTDFIIALPG